MDSKLRLNVGHLIKTKIVATLGPASNDEQTLREMIGAGLDMMRLNFSHGTHEGQKQVFDLCMKLSAEHDHQFSVLCDIQGPKIRTGKMKEPWVAAVGAEVLVTSSECLGDSKKFQIKYPSIVDDLDIGDVIFINDGIVRLKVQGKTDDACLRCVVETSGLISDKKGCNIPSGNLSVQLPTPKDLRDLEFIAALKPDYIAVSFVGCAQDLRNVRESLRGFGFPDAKLCAKIERPVCFEGNNLQEIVEEADCVMVARGDLGVEVDPWLVPVYQNQIIKMCNEGAVPCIVATQMLESMTTTARPTRAEVSDVFGAAFQGADAVMLSGETSVGKYPVLAVKTMDRIVEEAERQIASRETVSAPPGGNSPQELQLVRSVAPGVREVASSLRASGRRCAILTACHSGTTVRLLSSLRLQVPIFAFSPDARVLRSVAVLWGVRGILTQRGEGDAAGGLARMRQTSLQMGTQGEANYFLAIKQAHELDLLQPDDIALVVSSSMSLPHHSGLQLCVYKVSAVLETLK